jgi:hypothetical protein
MSSKLLTGDVCQVTQRAHLIAAAAEPGEFSPVVLGGAGADERLDRKPAPDHADGRAVPRRRVVKKIGEPQASGARHVLRHNGRVAGNMPAHVP